MAASRHRGCERNRSQGPKMFATSLEDRRELPGGSQEILRLLVDTMPMQRPVRVLVVDDEENIRELLAMGLRYEGFEVEVGDGGRAALAAVPKFRPDLIVLDVMMPDLEGFEVCRRLQSEGVRAPVIFLTARKSLGDRLTGLTIGADDYLTKPFS